MTVSYSSDSKHNCEVHANATTLDWDVASLSLLASAPYYFLLALFYEITLAPILIGLAIDLTSTTLPFVLLRRLNAHNRLSSASANAQLANSYVISAYTTLFGTAMYAVIVYSSLYTWLPVYLVNNFDSIRTLEHAHGANLPLLFLASLPLGIAAKDFLFGPSIYYSRSAATKEFDAAAATLSETFAYNLGLSGWGSREEILAKRTVLVVVLTLANSAAKVFGTVEGADPWGAFGWGTVFASAATMAGIGFTWVGDV